MVKRSPLWEEITKDPVNVDPLTFALLSATVYGKQLASAWLELATRFAIPILWLLCETNCVPCATPVT
jgi:hypothetical protein